LRKINKKLEWKNIIGYSMYNFAGGTDMIAAVWLMYFYTTFCDVSIVAVGVILTVTRFLTSLLSPIVGHISDNFYKNALGRKFGRRKFFLLVCIPLRAIIIPLIWLPGQSTLYYCIVCVLGSCIGLFYLIPAKALLAEMPRSSEEKVKITGLTQFASNLTSISVSAFPGIMFTLFGQNNIESFTYMIWSYDVIATTSLIIFYHYIIERSVEEVGYDTIENKNISPIKWFKNMIVDVASTVKIRAYRSYLGMFLTQTVCRAISGSLHTYFVVFILALGTTVVSVISTLSYAFGILFLGMFVAINNKIGGPKSYRVGAYIALTAFAVYFVVAFVHPDNPFVLACVLACVLYCGKTGMVNSTTYQASFIPDIDEAVTGVRREGSFTGVDNFTDAICSAAEMLMVSLILGATGFAKGGQIQPESAMHALVALFTITPSICIIIGLVISYKSNFTLEKYHILSDEVARLRAGGSMQLATIEAKNAFEDLTGFKYENCWGNNNILSANNEQAAIAEIALKDNK
jgi:oligogalacturonide transporter